MNKRKVVIVSYSEMLCESLTEIFQQFYDVQHFDELKLENIKKINPSLILLDVFEKNEKGFSLIKELKHDNDFHKIPVIMMAKKMVGRNYEERCFMSGAADFIYKPLESSIVLLRARAQIQSYETNKLLLESSFYDPLTQMYNRRAFDDYLLKECNKCDRSGKPLSMLLLDIDYFKLYNDKYGHLMGDDALKLVGGKIKEVVRSSDVAARWGGEEFAVILPNTDEEGAAKIAEHLNRAIASLNIKHETSKLVEKVVTVSIGVTTSLMDFDKERILSEADKMLYGAKEAGRNRFCQHSAT